MKWSNETNLFNSKKNQIYAIFDIAHVRYHYLNEKIYTELTNAVLMHDSTWKLCNKTPDKHQHLYFFIKATHHQHNRRIIIKGNY